jgi:hypothetical protein
MQHLRGMTLHRDGVRKDHPPEPNTNLSYPCRMHSIFQYLALALPP